MSTISKSFLDAFYGYLQTDDYVGYNNVEAAKKVIVEYRYIFHTDCKILEEYGNQEKVWKKYI